MKLFFQFYFQCLTWPQQRSTISPLRGLCFPSTRLMINRLRNNKKQINCNYLGKGLLEHLVEILLILPIPMHTMLHKTRKHSLWRLPRCPTPERRVNQASWDWLKRWVKNHKRNQEVGHRDRISKDWTCRSAALVQKRENKPNPQLTV